MQARGGMWMVGSAKLAALAVLGGVVLSGPVVAQEPGTREMQAFSAFQNYCVASDADRTTALAAAEAAGLTVIPREDLRELFINAEGRIGPNGDALLVADLPSRPGQTTKGILCGLVVEDLQVSRLAELINGWQGVPGAEVSPELTFPYTMSGDSPRRVPASMPDQEIDRLIASGDLRVAFIDNSRTPMIIGLMRMVPANAP